MGNQGGIYKNPWRKKKEKGKRRQKTLTCKYEQRLDSIQLFSISIL